MMAFQSTHGFARHDVSLHNWRERPYSPWSFQHVNEFVPSARVGCGTPDAAGEAASFEDMMVSPAGADNGEPCHLSAFLERSETDLFAVMRDGRVVMEWTAPHADRALPHLVFSVSKSVTALLAAILEQQGVLDLTKTVSHYVPETANSGFGDCSLRHLLDMRVSLGFKEEYLDDAGDYARYRRSTLWNPPIAGQPVEDMLSMLCSLSKSEGLHGGSFHYLSPNSDMLGILLERATGTRFADLMSSLLWQPMNADADAWMTVDAAGHPRAAGGLSITARDLLAIGDLLCTDGAVGSRQIVPAAWIADMHSNGDRTAWTNGNFAGFSTINRYRSQWYQLAEPAKVSLAIGIHGQWLYVDHATRTVIVKLSSQTLPMNEPLDEECIRVFQELVTLL